MKNKVFTIFSIMMLFTMLIVLACFNYFVDSYGFFNKNSTVALAAKNVAIGNTIIGLSNYDERLFQKQVFQNFETCPETIVIGSSRTMMIQSEMLNAHGKVFNHSVSGASLEDYVAILGMYAQKNKLPKKVILGIDPWIFNKNNGQNRWRSLSLEYHFMLKQLGNRQPQASVHGDKSKYLQLINFENTKNNIVHARDNFSNVAVITDENIDAFIKRGDGSIAYPFKTRFQNDNETQKQAKAYLTGQIYSVDNFKKLSNTELFETLVFYLRSHGSKVELFLPPYHPIVYKYFIDNHKYANIVKTEEYLRNFVKSSGIKLYGSYNPAVFGFKSNDFTDGMHSKTSVAMQIFLDCLPDNINKGTEWRTPLIMPISPR